METSSPATLEWVLPPSSSSDGEEEEEEEVGESPPPPRPSALSSFDRDRHVAYLEMTYHMLPYHYQGQEINHLTLAYFTISGLQLLRALDRVDKDAVVAWVLSFLAQPSDAADLNNGQFYGFNGSKSSQYPSDSDGMHGLIKRNNKIGNVINATPNVLIHNHSHLASTYSALAILKAVGYNLSNVDSKMILKSLRNLQQPDGSFLPIHIGAETDLRFLYCAAAICFMLEDWSGMDREKAKEYIIKCQSYDGGFGMIPGSESHGGGTYCAVASLRLMGFIEDVLLSKGAASSIIDVPLLLEWCFQRQAADGGFQGRSNKASDTCYAFWVGAVLRILGGYHMIDGESLRGFLLACQSEYGGFGKFQGELPDLYHSYYGFTAFSLLGEDGLDALCAELGIAHVAAIGI